jgi:hypothetical protein
MSLSAIPEFLQYTPKIIEPTKPNSELFELEMPFLKIVSKLMFNVNSSKQFLKVSITHGLPQRKHSIVESIVLSAMFSSLQLIFYK